MLPLTKGRYRARAAETVADLRAAQALRGICFPPASGTAGPDVDDFDARCTHILVEDTCDGALVCCYRILPLPGGTGIDESYAAQFYDLAALRAFDGPMTELGRFCIRPDRRDPDILRIAWAALTGIVDTTGVEMLFGCASFRGTDTSVYRDAFALLRARHLAPSRWQPKAKATKVHRFASGLHREPDVKRAALAMPPLLKTYLMMGGWVSDHAVVDTRLNTLHVFTGLEIRAIPDTRKRLLRAAAG